MPLTRYFQEGNVRIIKYGVPLSIVLFVAFLLVTRYWLIPEKVPPNGNEEDSTGFDPPDLSEVPTTIGDITLMGGKDEGIKQGKTVASVSKPKGPPKNAEVKGDPDSYKQGVKKDGNGKPGPDKDTGKEVDGQVVTQQETIPVSIAILHHNFTNYHQHQGTLTEFTNWLRQNTQFRYSGPTPVPFLSPIEKKLDKVYVLFITGDDVEYAKGHGGLRQGWTNAWNTTSFSKAERKALKKYVGNGGTIFFNYGRGRGEKRDFSQTMRNELEKTFKKKLQKINPDIPYLQGIGIKGRYAIFFSSEDILSQRPWKFLTYVLGYALKHGRSINIDNP